MYLVVSLFVTLISHNVWGSPIYFPDEVKNDNDGKGYRLLPGIYLHPAPKSLESKPIPAMISFGVTGKDDSPTLIMKVSAKLERLRNTVGTEPLPSDYVHQSDNTTDKIAQIGPKGNYLENKQIKETSLLSTTDEPVNKGGNNTQEIDSEIIVKAQSNDTSISSLEYDFDFELSNNDSKIISIEEMDSDIQLMDVEIVTEVDYLTTEISTVNESTEKSVEVESDATLHFDSEGSADSESSTEIMVFGNELKKPEGDILIFPTPKSPVKPIPAEKSRFIKNIPDSNQCQIEGEILYQGECYALLSSWPCGGEDKWLVMKDYDLAECEPRPCPMGQLFYQDKCVNLEDSTICANGQMLYVEMTGIAYCDCDPDYIYFPQDGTCIPEYEQGWCPWGEYLVRNEYGHPECVSNPCKISGSVYHEENKKCYKKNYVGYCEQEFINIKENVAECEEIEFIFALRNVFEVPTFRRCPKGSLRDLLHECRRRFNMPSISSVLKARQLYGGCPHGWTKAAGKKCKKIVNLFSYSK